MMICAIEFKDNNSIYCDFVKLNKKSFSFLERPLSFVIKKVIKKRKNVHLFCYYENEQFIGMSLSASFNDYATIYLLAVNPDIRSKGYGSQILNHLKEFYKDKNLFLNYEELDKSKKDYDTRVARANFYRKNGFIDAHIKVREFFVKFDVACTKEDSKINIHVLRAAINILYPKFICYLFVSKLNK